MRAVILLAAALGGWFVSAAAEELPESPDRIRRNRFPDVRCEVTPTAPPHPVRLNVPYFSGYMVRAAEDAPKLVDAPPRGGRQFAFRRDFRLDALPVKVQLTV